MEMKDMLFMHDCYIKEFTATVQEVSPSDDAVDGVPTTYYIVLNETAFYPVSGGQPADTGLLIKTGTDSETEEEEFKVLNTMKKGDTIYHEVDAKGLGVGDYVKGRIDWNKRYMYMRYHSALHVISAVLWNETNAKITGNNITYEKARIDFNLEHFDRDALEDYIKKANEIIKENHPIEIKIIDRDNLETERDAIIKLAKSIPASVKKIRLIDIKDVDIQPCAGCHVKNTSEIGLIELLKVDNKGSNNRRLSIRVLNDGDTPGALDQELEQF